MSDGSSGTIGSQLEKADSNTARDYCFTIFGFDRAKLPLTIPDGAVKFLVVQEESCPKSGRLHLQGFIQLSSPQRWSALKKWDSNWARGSFYKRRGTPAEAAIYCGKTKSQVPGGYCFSVGKLSSVGQGKRSDLDSVAAVVRDGGSLLDVATAAPTSYIKYYRGIGALKDILNDKKRTWKTEVHVLWGPPGTGKTFFAQKEAGESVYWLRKGNGGSVWWDGYHGEESVILDDFYGWLPFDLLLRMCDAYPLQVDTKGAATQFLAKRIFITSNISWEDWYKYSQSINKGALERRITSVKFMDKKYSGDVGGGSSHGANSLRIRSTSIEDLFAEETRDSPIHQDEFTPTQIQEIEEQSAPYKLKRKAAMIQEPIEISSDEELSWPPSDESDSEEEEEDDDLEESFQDWLKKVKSGTNPQRFDFGKKKK